MGLVILVMGVAGAGKTTTGRALAEAIGAEFLDGDDFHSPENVAKMSRGVPLDDADRDGWLAILRKVVDERSSRGGSLVLACSLLKRTYRQKMGLPRPDARLVYLRCDSDVLRARLRSRPNHFMKEAMLDSQLAALEEPDDALVVDSNQSLESTVKAVIEGLRLPSP